MTQNEKISRIQPARKAGKWDESLYNSLVDLVLTHKSELKKYPEAMSRTTATAWGAKRGLHLGEPGEDLNHDGVEDVVLYNKAGKPVVVNGYKAHPSDFAARQEYYDAYPTKEARMERSFKDWGKTEYYKTKKNPDNPWKQSVEMTDKARNLKEKGCSIPTAPTKRMSVYAIFSKLIAPFVKMWEEQPIGQSNLPMLVTSILGEQAGLSNVRFFKRVVSPISIYRALYMKMVLRPFFFELTDNNIIPPNYESFNKYIKENPDQLYSFFKQYLTEDQLQFKENFVTPAVIGSNMVKDDVNWDGSDPDDVIVFLIGLKNLNNEYFNELLKTEGEAAEFMANKKVSPKALDKFKKISNASTKEFFANQIDYLFMNSGAKERYNAIKANGGNVLIQNVEQAQQDAEQGAETPQIQLPRVLVDETEQ